MGRRLQKAKVLKVTRSNRPVAPRPIGGRRSGLLYGLLARDDEAAGNVIRGHSTRQNCGRHDQQATPAQPCPPADGTSTASLTEKESVARPDPPCHSSKPAETLHR